MPYLTLQADPDTPPFSLHYQIGGAADAKDAIVCVHELGGSLETFSPMIQCLGDQFRVITFDQRGCGRSEHPVSPYSIADLADDLELLLQALNLDGRIHLVGLAMGSLVALRHVIRHRKRISSLTLFDGTGEITEAASKYILDRARAVRIEGMRAVAQMSFKNAFRGLEQMSGTPEFLDQQGRFLANSPHSYAFHSEALAAGGFTDQELMGVSCPTLVATGEADFIWPPATGQALAQRIPTARFETIAKAAHFPPLQAPDSSARLLESFITEQQRVSDAVQ